jgi:hypothetical protein
MRGKVLLFDSGDRHLGNRYIPGFGAARATPPPGLIFIFITGSHSNFYKFFCRKKNIIIFAIQIRTRSVRLGVRTPGFHPGNRGSIPLRTAKIFFNKQKAEWQIIHQQPKGPGKVRKKSGKQVLCKTMRNAVRKLRATQKKKRLRTCCR